MRNTAVRRSGGRAVTARLRGLGLAVTIAAFLTALPPDRLTAQVGAQVGAEATSRYWQQHVHYTIHASLDEPSGILTGSGQLVYRNNSPNTLTEFYFHQYLNAFRPASLWSADERREGIDRFADLPEPYHAFERFGTVRIGGVAVTPSYPHAPDSTIARFALPRPLRPGDSLVVQLEWTARPSVIPRRQGRQGRRFDFAQWYPKVSVYDRDGWQDHPLRMAGELYGEFGTYDVTLDLAEDQVVAATGLPVEGDPGWESAGAQGGTVTLQRDWYPSFRRTTYDTRRPAPGRKLVRFYAEDIHHFAFSMNPAYRYEEGRYGDVVLRTLYLPEDSATWGGGRVIERTQRAMAWLDTIFGAYPYPQTVVLHRIEGGGTEFPMLVMNGGPQESLIFHEVGHIYAYGILANNEWKEAWLDEGLTTFQTAWNFQRRGMGVPSTQTQQLILDLDLEGWSEPISQPGEDFREFYIYNRMVHTKAQLVFEMLRYQVGEAAFRRGLRLYYDRWKLKHVNEAAFRQAMEEASGRNLREFFEQWLRESRLVDYAIGRVENWHLENGSWRTRVTANRVGGGVMPMDVGVPAGDTTYAARATLRRTGEFVEINTPVKPGDAELDPARQTMDWNYLNNRQGPHLFPFFVGARSPRPLRRLGWSSTAPARRDRLVQNWLPLIWYNDPGGVTIGFQVRTNYLGRFEQNDLQLANGMRQDFPDGFNGYFALRNPVWARRPRMRWGLEAFNLDGRAGVKFWQTRDVSPHVSFGPRITWGMSVAHLVVFDATYVDSTLWEPLYTIEGDAFLGLRWAGRGRLTELRGSGGLGVGGAPRRVGFRDARTWGRAALEVRHQRSAGPVALRGKILATAVARFGPSNAPRQRLLYLAGADPYETFKNPFLRSRGAPLVRPDVNYSSPGGGGLRAFNTSLVANRMLAVNLEAGVPLFRRPARRVFSSLSLAVFADGAWFAVPPDTLRTIGLGPTLTDAGFGIRATHRVGPTTFVTRVDFPVLVNEPKAAIGASPLDGQARFRLVWSLEDAF